jgi:hypothetical protein
MLDLADRQLARPDPRRCGRFAWNYDPLLEWHDHAPRISDGRDKAGHSRARLQ